MSFFTDIFAGDKFPFWNYITSIDTAIFLRKMKKNNLLMLLFGISICSCSCKKEPLSKSPIENRYVDVVYDSNKSKTELSFEEIKEDLETFIYLLETSYAGFEDAVERGLDLNIQKQKILSSIDKQKKTSVYDFLSILYKNFETYIRDYHASLAYENVSYIFIKPYDVYFTDIYVQKIGEAYYKYGNNSNEIRTGAQYESEIDKIFYYPGKGIDIYRLGIISSENVDKICVKFNGKDYNIHVEKCSKENSDFAFFEKESDKSVYIKYNRCRFNNSAELESLKTFAKSAEKYRNKEFIIIDVRGNYGGDSNYGTEFLAKLYNQKSSLNDVFEESRTILSPVSIDSMIKSLNANCDVNDSRIKKTIKGFKNLRKLNDKKAYKIIKNTNKNFILKDNPDFKGKIIFITDSVTASSGEYIIATSQTLFGKTKQVIQLGQNTAGCVSYGNLCRYYLSNSGIRVALSITDMSRNFKGNDSYHGEGYGFFPDYWAENEDLNDTIYYVTKDKEMYDNLKELL